MKSAVVVLTCLLLCFAAQCSVVAQVDENREPVSVSVLEVAPAVDSDGGEVDRERVLAVKVALRQLAETKRFRLIEAMKLRRAANDDAVCEYLALKYQQEFDEIEAQAAAGDQFLKWIEWAIKNQDSIIKFVTTLIDLFSGKTAFDNQLLVAGPVSRAWQLQKATQYRVRNFEQRVIARVRG